MKIRHSVKLAITALCFAVLPSTSYALLSPDAALEDSLTDVELEALATLALADEPMRDAILEVSLHPRAVERIASISQDSSDRFRERMNEIPRSKQKGIWELVRYPDLVDALVLGGRPSRGSIDEVVAPYPEEIRDIAKRTALHDFNLLNDIAHIRSDAERETSKLIATLPLSAQANFETLIHRPELMTALADHPALLHELGSRYRDDPFETRAAFDRYHEEETARNEEAIAEWRGAIEDDPEAREELIESAEQFADEEGYESPTETQRVVERTEVHYYHHPYPYWFGTPYWHASRHWYPHRAHWGFSFDVAGAFFVFGLPSAYYSSWHYRVPERRHHYRHLDRHFQRHASHHRSRRGSGIRDHARSHKQSRKHAYDRPRDGRRHVDGHRVADYRNGSRSRVARHRDDRDRRGIRSRIGTRDGERDIRPRKHKSKFREATERARRRDGKRNVRPRQHKSKFREATERARTRGDDGRQVRSRKRDRSADRADSFTRKTRGKHEKRVSELGPKRERNRSASNKKGIRGKARRSDSHKIAKRSSKPSKFSSTKRKAKRSPRAKIKSPKHAEKLTAKSKRSEKSKKKRSNGGRNFARR